MPTCGAILTPHVAARLPARLAETLTGLGTAANELSLAVAEARLHQHRTRLALAHVSERENHPYLPPEYSMIAEWRTAAREHAERLLAIYTHIAATYAAHTIDAFTLLARGDEPHQWQSGTIVPSDILTMPDQFIPLVQLPDDTGTPSDRPHIPSTNAYQRQAHTHAVRAATRHTHREPATLFDQPEQLADRQINDHDEHGGELDDELPSAIHEYAAAAIYAFNILTRAHRDTRQ